MNDTRILAIKAINQRVSNTLSKYSSPEAQKIISILNNLQSSYEGLVSMNLNKDPLQSKEAHFVKVSNTAQRLLLEHKKYENNLTDQVSSYNSSLLNALKNKSGMNRESKYSVEIREKFYNLTQEVKGKELEKMIDDEDGETFASIVLAPAFITGLKESAQETYKKMFFAKVAPDLLSELNTLEKVIEAILTILETYRNGVQSYIDPEKLREIEFKKSLSDEAQIKLNEALSTSI